MSSRFTESVVEDAALAWLESLGYAIQHLPAPQNDTTRQAGGPEIAPGELAELKIGPLGNSTTEE